MRSDKYKTEEKEIIEIKKADYLGNLNLLLTFTNGVQKRIDFESIFQKFAKGYYEKYSSANRFKRFVLSSGNISWGKNEDIIFPVDFLYNHPKAKQEKEEVLFVI